MPADIYHSKAGRRMVKHGEIDRDMAIDMEYIYICTHTYLSIYIYIYTYKLHTYTTNHIHTYTHTYIYNMYYMIYGVLRYDMVRFHQI